MDMAEGNIVISLTEQSLLFKRHMLLITAVKHQDLPGLTAVRPSLFVRPFTHLPRMVAKAKNNRSKFRKFYLLHLLLLQHMDI